MLTPLLLASLLQVPQPTQELSPGTRYDPSIPTLEQVAGHDFGEEVTSPDEIVRYMKALAEAAPELAGPTRPHGPPSTTSLEPMCSA